MRITIQIQFYEFATHPLSCPMLFYWQLGIHGRIIWSFHPPEVLPQPYHSARKGRTANGILIWETDVKNSLKIHESSEAGKATSMCSFMIWFIKGGTQNIKLTVSPEYGVVIVKESQKNLIDATSRSIIIHVSIRPLFEHQPKSLTEKWESLI